MRRRRRQTAFTLVELTVALVAGLIVALAIVGLSREATTTFHEEVRSSAAEAALRTAVDRLRADLQRAAFMSTPDITRDPRIALPPGASLGTYVSMPGILRLAGIHLVQGGSASATPLSGAQQPALSPDTLEIGGNMTSADQFEVETMGPGSGSCTRLWLSATSPAILRIAAVGSVNEGAELNNAFQPYTQKQFIVRLVDDTGRSQFLATCSGPTTAGFVGTQPYVDIDSTDTPILTSQVTKTVGGVSSTPSGRASVNPVQIVRWDIEPATSEPTQLQGLGNEPLSPGTTDPTKYDLIRTFLDVTDQPVTQTAELIAEYAVDLKIAFSVDEGSAGTPQMLTLDYDDTNNQNWAVDVSTLPSLATTQTLPAPQGPQRIRLVRARIVTRTALADRATNIPVNPANVGTEAFLYRYAVNPDGGATGAGALPWARTRTITTEVSLPNQAASYY